MCKDSGFTIKKTFLKPVNRHWMEGGTGVTNFDKKCRARYAKAIGMYGDKNLVICDLPLPFQGQTEPCAYGIEKYHSLHHLSFGDLSKFWRIYDGLKDLVPDVQPVVDPYAELKAAQKAGKNLQIRTVSHNATWWSDWTPDWTLSADHYRVKPEARLRPWKANEVPVGAQWRNNARFREEFNLNTNSRHLITGVTQCGNICTTGGEIRSQDTPEYFLKSNEYSTDNGATWAPCGVVEEV